MTRPVARGGLVGDRADVRGRVNLVSLDAARDERIAQRRRKRLGGHQRLREARHLHAEFVGALQDDAQERRRADVSGRLQIGHRRDLLLGLPRAAREYRAAECMRAAFEHRARGREVVGKAIVHEVAGAKAGGEQRAREPPVIRRGAFRLVDRARARRTRAARGPIASLRGRRTGAPRVAGRRGRTCARSATSPSASRDVTPAASTSANARAKAGALAFAYATWRASCANCSRSRCSGSRVSSAS